MLKKLVAENNLARSLRLLQLNPSVEKFEEEKAEFDPRFSYSEYSGRWPLRFHPLTIALDHYETNPKLFKDLFSALHVSEQTKRDILLRAIVLNLVKVVEFVVGPNQLDIEVYQLAAKFDRFEIFKNLYKRGKYLEIDWDKVLSTAAEKGSEGVFKFLYPELYDGKLISYQVFQSLALGGRVDLFTFAKDHEKIDFLRREYDQITYRRLDADQMPDPRIPFKEYYGPGDNVYTPFRIAAESGNAELSDDILKHVMKVAASMWFVRDGLYAAIAQSKRKVVRRILDNFVTYIDQEAGMLAVQSGDAEILRMVLEYHSNVILRHPFYHLEENQLRRPLLRKEIERLGFDYLVEVLHKT